MAQMKIACGAAPLITIRAETNLSIRGGSALEIQITVEDLRDLSAIENENGVTIASEEDCAVVVPLDGKIVVESAGGNVSVSDFTGGLQISHIDGNVSLSRVGDAVCRDIDGNCRVDNAGMVTIEDLDGNLKGSELVGPLTALKVDGNINIGAAGSVLRMDADGNIKIGVLEVNNDLEMAAGGNLQMFLPNQPGFILDAASGGKLVIQLGGESEKLSKPVRGMRIGAGGSRMKIAAGGNVTLSDRGFGESGGAVDSFSAGIHAAIGAELKSAGIDERLQKRIEERVRRAEHRANAVRRKAEHRVREAMRKVEGMDFSDIISSSLQSAGWQTGFDTPEVETVEEREEVTDAEKMLILNMLQEKKITAEEAERLLDALAGKFG